ncbi:3',5'-cyclic adenosine monophosphate phosphodiesterase CpdA [Paenibacillus sp. CECT 9249]|uniref:S-layer homology domain-containing protein n=1 Tax=Paenibacillus sp. CECT 9249 TaxID=2845385 RepID=UPI001E53203F|nr:S-layer homology domain-containing protein [Paenibacillus sp. CECT 9249]CAH0120684.1 3',5'-cyclic adenosine monophosphate phosphodiesterase CpdA [Paenibacillus sp. CECT 9249]
MYKKLLSMLLSTALVFGLLAGFGSSPAAEAATQDEPMILLERNSEWKYFDQGQDLNSVWRATYDDSLWDSGFAPFGYKDNGSGIATSAFGPLNTEVGYGPDKKLKHRTTYFRTNLQVNKDEIDGYGQLLGTFGIDDGAVIYVNGHEVRRFGMPEGEITYSTKAISNKDLPVLYENVDLTQPLKSYLKDGNNEIAVEVHQQSDSSSDLYFDMELTALVQAPALEISKVTVTFYGDATSAKGFTWYTPLGSFRSDVQVVENQGGAPDFSQAQVFTGRTSVSSNSPGEHVHKAEATGLTADTSYYFRVGDSSLDLWSETGTFRTAPADGAFTFIDLTDTQAKDESEAMLSAATLSKALAAIPEAEFVVHNGDVVENGTSEQEWNWLLGHSQSSLLHTTIVPSAGNHENKNYAFYEHFNVQQPDNAATITGAYYSYDYSNAHFIVLNSNENSPEYANFSAEQVAWMKQDVEQAKAAGAEWIIANIHKGPYTTSNHATDSDIIGANGVRNKIAPLMNELGIDLVLQGHDHIYARTKPIKSDGTAEDVAKITETLNGQSIEYAVKPDGTIYMIPATAGAKVYFKNQKPELGDAYFNLFERAEENHARKYGDTTSSVRGQVQNFVGITIDGGKLTAVTYEIDQNQNNAQPFIVDQFGITKETKPDPVEEKVSKVTVTFHGDTKTSKGFTWYTSEQVTGSDLQVVEKSAAAPDFANAISFQGRSATSTNSPAELVHKAEATGLKPNTSYVFRVGDAALGVWSDTGTFRTAPEKGAFTFIDLADTQAKNEEEAILSSETLAKALATVPEAQFVVHNGDIVDKGVKEEQWNWLLGHSQESLLHTTLAPSAGNHEDENYAFIEHFNVLPPENSATETGAFYSYDYSNAHFVILNSNEDSDTYDNFSVEQVEWLKQDVQQAKKAGAKWIIVNIHKGPYTTSNHATDSDIMGANGVRNQIAPLMAELGIDLVLQGHDHIYARTKPIKPNGKATEPVKITETLNGEKIEYSVNPDGTIYLIPATAGPKVYYKNPSPSLGDAYYSLFERAEENHAAKYGPDPKDNRRPMRSQVQNFVGITIDGSKLTAVTYEIDQNQNNAQPFIVDQFGIVKKDVAKPNPEPGNPGSGTPGSGTSGSGTGSNTGAGSGSGSGSEPDSDKGSDSGNGTDPGSDTSTGSQPGSNPGTGSGRENPPALKDTEGHWAKAAIDQGVAAGFVNGYGDGTFRPNRQVTRAEFVTMLGRALNLDAGGTPLTFTDTSNIPSWAKDAVAQAVEAGIISGYKDGTFGPHKPLNRAELAAMIVRAGGIRPDSAAKLAFTDAKDIPAWARPYIAAAVDAGLVGGVGNNRFAPRQVATRAEAVTLVIRLLEYVK